MEPPKESAPCECCGGKTTLLTRFVYRDNDAHAIYFAQFSYNHPDRVVLATISLGEWGEGTTPAERVAFALKMRAAESTYDVALIDAAQSPWKDAVVIGRTLDRVDALAHSRLSEVFHITDHMVVEDIPLKRYLDATSTNA
jgi:hypothetical protein